MPLHDRHVGILRAILDLQNGRIETGDPPKWRDIHSRWCMRHIGANFLRQYKSKHLMDEFKSLCKETNQRKFSRKWEKLEELTGKKTREDSKNQELDRTNRRPYVLCLHILQVLGGGLVQV